MNRADFQKLSRIRLREAKALLDRGLHDGAYYLAGYAVECALKACIARKTKRYDFPIKKTVMDSYTHDLSKLVEVAGLEQERKNRIAADQEFELRWGIVKDWDEDSRYRSPSKEEARQLYGAIVNRQHGVLRWLKQFW